MFTPDADVLPYNIDASNDTESTKKVINRNNTRLPEQRNELSNTGGASEPPSPTRSRVEAAITNTPCK